MADPNLLTGTLDELVVGEGETVRLRGTVLGDVEVQYGGSLIHEGLITGLLYVESGGHLYLHGRAEEARWEEASDVELHGMGTPPVGDVGRPSTGPEGWGSLDAAWARSITELDKAAFAADLGSYLQERKEDVTEDAFRAAAATMAISGRTDAQLWALLAAAVFNEAQSARIRGAERRGIFSPEDCRQRLPWTDLDGFFDSPPELFERLLSHADRAGRSLAFDCYEALSEVIRAVLAVADAPADEAVATVERFRTVLRQRASAAGSEPLRPARKPRSSRPAREKTARSRTATGSGAARATASPSAICAETDPVDAANCELDSLIGLDGVKEQVRQLGTFAAIERRRVLSGRPETDITRHLVMTGNPGTGKTTVARLLGSIYVGYGLLQRDTIIEVTRSELVDKYVGKTDENVKAAFDRAAGGILFIDEAYSLAGREGEPDYGRQAIDTLVPLMENRRREIMVIAAGYPELMRRFLRANPGLDGRFGTTIPFPNYSDAELLAILRRFCERGEFDLDAGALESAARVIEQARSRMGDRFDNARMVRRLFEKMVQRHHDRVFQLERRARRTATASELSQLSAADVPTAEQLVPDADDDTVLDAAG
jgi:SpoVK/Ycf46/Vps4 family AAA+-type ATPase